MKPPPLGRSLGATLQHRRRYSGVTPPPRTTGAEVPLQAPSRSMHGPRSLGAKPPDLSKRSMNEAPQETSLASKLMFVFMSFETGHPVLLSLRWIGLWVRRYRVSSQRWKGALK